MFYRPFVISLLILVLAPCHRGDKCGRVAAAQTAQEGTPAGLHFVVGRVFEGLGQTPVSDALVTLRGRTAPSFQLRTLTTANGDFVLFHVPSGAYDLSASKAGYTVGNFGQRRVAGPSRPLELTEGQPQGDLRIPVWSEAAICGTVRDEAGEPVVDIRVEALSYTASGGRLLIRNTSPQSARTDDRGRYRIFGLMPGRYLVMIPPVELTDGPTSEGSQATLTVIAGQERCDVDLSLRTTKTFRISGRVSGASAVVSMTVQIVRPDDHYLEDIVIAETRVGADSSFVFTRVPPGDFIIRAIEAAGSAGLAGGVPRAAGRSMFATSSPTGSSRSGGARMSPDVPVSVSDTDVLGVSVAFHSGTNIEGRVVFNGAGPPPPLESLPPILLRMTLINGRELAGPSAGFVHVETDGQFHIRGLQTGRYFVQIGTGVPPGWAVESVELQGRSVIDEPLALERDNVSGLVVTLTDRVSEVTGIVRTEGGLADATAVVLVFPADSDRWIDFGRASPRMRAVPVAVNGTYSVRGLLPGEYRLLAVADEFTDLWQTRDRLQQLSRSASLVTMTPGARIQLDMRTSAAR